MRIRGDRARTIAADERGSYQTEYTVVLVLVGLVTAAAVASLAIPLLTYHQAVERAITEPFP